MENKKTVVVTADQGIATITLNRPEAMNAFNRELVDELIRSLQEVKSDNAIKAIVLTGNGKAFTAGV